MKKTVIVGLLFGVVGIVAFRSWWIRAGAILQSAGVVEPIENFLPVRPSTRPASGVHPLAKIMKGVDYQKRPLEEVIEDIRKQTGANIVVQWDTIVAAGVEASAPITLQLRDLPAERVLELVLTTYSRIIKLGTYVDDDGVVTITTQHSLPLVLRVYNVRDILVNSIRFQRSFAAIQPETKSGAIDEEQAINDLMHLIREGVLPDLWQVNGGNCFCRMMDGKLFVSQTPEGHAELEKFLAKCREK